MITFDLFTWCQFGKIVYFFIFLICSTNVVNLFPILIVNFVSKVIKGGNYMQSHICRSSYKLNAIAFIPFIAQMECDRIHPIHPTKQSWNLVCSPEVPTLSCFDTGISFKTRICLGQVTWDQLATKPVGWMRGTLVCDNSLSISKVLLRMGTCVASVPCDNRVIKIVFT